MEGSIYAIWMKNSIYASTLSIDVDFNIVPTPPPPILGMEFQFPMCSISIWIGRISLRAYIYTDYVLTVRSILYVMNVALEPYHRTHERGNRVLDWLLYYLSMYTNEMKNQIQISYARWLILYSTKYHQLTFLILL